jgi:hypothetical protein
VAVVGEDFEFDACGFAVIYAEVVAGFQVDGCGGNVSDYSSEYSSSELNEGREGGRGLDNDHHEVRLKRKGSKVKKSCCWRHAADN